MTPQGAQRLRQAREHIKAYPEQFSTAGWIDPTFNRCCTGGRIWMLEHGTREPFSLYGLMDLLGVNSREFWLSESQSLFKLFNTSYTADEAPARINAVLWHYGYPPEEVPSCPVDPLLVQLQDQ